MSLNNTIPLLIPYKQAIQAIQLTNTNGLQLEVSDTNNEIFIEPAINIVKQSEAIALNKSGVKCTNNVINNGPLKEDKCETTKNNDVNYNENMIVYQIIYPEDLQLKRHLKRGRPKNSLKKEEKKETTVENKTKPLIKVPRTRSGRIVKMPKQFEKDFAKILINKEPEMETAEFVQSKEPAATNNNKVVELQKLDHHQRKRKIAAQYRCPKCNKAYLGKYKMMEHIMRNPDHGPLPESNNNTNFDVWNYLVDITQKLPPKRRGAKFCEELTNLLHNVQLLTSALFKVVIDTKNCVQVDKVLGNAIGLQPGKYHFDENELYKDVTVLKLFTNTEFFTPKITNNYNCPTKKAEETFTPSTAVNNTFTTDSNFEKNDYLNCDKIDVHNEESRAELPSTSSSSIDSDLNFKKIDDSELLSAENSLLGALPNLRTSVDELMLSGVVVDTTSNLLDNSTSSDEVMNVDQFVNERFKKITEPDIELSNPAALNLDLPTLDLFQFHTS